MDPSRETRWNRESRPLLPQLLGISLSLFVLVSLALSNLHAGGTKKETKKQDWNERTQVVIQGGTVSHVLYCLNMEASRFSCLSLALSDLLSGEATKPSRSADELL